MTASIASDYRLCAVQIPPEKILPPGEQSPQWRGAPRPRTENLEALQRSPPGARRSLPTPPPGYRWWWKPRTSTVRRVISTTTNLGRGIPRSRITAGCPDLSRPIDTTTGGGACGHRAPRIAGRQDRPLVRDEVVAALAAEEDGSPTALALKGSISSAVAIRLATILRTETGGKVPPPAPRGETVPCSSFNFADPIGVVPGIDTMDPHPEGRAIYLPAVHGATRGPQEMSSPYSPVRVAPAGRKPPEAPRDRKMGPVPVEQTCTKHVQNRSGIHPVFRRR